MPESSHSYRKVPSYVANGIEPYRQIFNNAAGKILRKSRSGARPFSLSTTDAYLKTNVTASKNRLKYAAGRVIQFILDSSSASYDIKRNSRNKVFFIESVDEEKLVFLVQSLTGPDVSNKSF